MRWLSQLPAGAAVLDVASGAGRHAAWAAARGLRVTALDRDPAALAALAEAAPGVATVTVDLEAGEWPLPDARFDAVLCTNYLYRPRIDRLAAWLSPGGRLVYETFAQGNERYGRPSRPDFLLAPGELLAVAARNGLRVIAYEDGTTQRPRPARVQRIVASAPGGADEAPLDR